MTNLLVSAFVLLAGLNAYSHGPNETLPTPTLSAGIGGMGYGNELGISPFQDWKTFSTEHFRLTFEPENKEFAVRASQNLEEAFSLLSPYLKWTPRTRIHVLILDNLDAANGMAAAALRFGMVIYATPPESWFSTAYYDDWVRMLCLHELVHVLNMDPTYGWSEALRWIFGDTLRLTATWPRWMLEGLAVYLETRYTQAGRGRSTFYEMVLRTAVHEGELNGPLLNIDKINILMPWGIGGETPYFFGYQLMNQAAKDGPLGEAGLGEMSYRSGARIPYFINGNAENVTGKSWYNHWNAFVKDTHVRMSEALRKLKETPLTEPEALYTQRSLSALAPVVSPNGEWLAYSHDSPDQRTGLFLKNLKNGETQKVDDKLMGVGLSFSPDSQYLVYSGLERNRNYYLWSELSVLHLPSGKITQLSDRQRLRDPAFSPDGKRLVFTVAHHSRTELAMADFDIKNGAPTLGTVQVLVKAPIFDRISHPAISPNGKSVAYSVHQNGKPSEEIWEYSFEQNSASEKVNNGAFNRFPTFRSDGSLFYVSDFTGVDNIWKWQADRPLRVTHTATGIWFPSFGPKDSTKPYASVFGSYGWDIAQIQIQETGFAENSASSAPQAAHPPKGTPAPTTHSQEPPIANYAAWKSLAPRLWGPMASYSSEMGLNLTAQAAGFDSLDLHQYLIQAGWDSLIGLPNFKFNYANRSLGITLLPNIEFHTSRAIKVDGKLAAYRRELEGGIDASFPFQSTWKNLTAVASVSAYRAWTYQDGLLAARTITLPRIETGLLYSDPVTSRLSVAQEGGRRTHLQLGHFIFQGTSSTKVVLGDTEYFHLGDHWVLIPQIAGAFSTKTNRDYLDSYVSVENRASTGSTEAFNQNLTSLKIRGYAGGLYVSRSALTSSLDLRFPLQWILSYWGTNPWFFKNLQAFAFAESAYFPISGIALPSVGLGTTLNTEVFLRIPLNFTVEFDRGFNGKRGGKGEFLISAYVGGFSF